MLSKNQLKYLHSLRLGKFRDLNGAFTAEGVKLVDDLIHSDFTVISVYGTREWQESHIDIIRSGRINFQEITHEELERASGMSTPNEVIAVVAIPERIFPGANEPGRLVLCLDRIQDPGNLGTIIRTADWFGVRHIVCSPDTVDVYNPKVVQATMGSVFRVNVHYRELPVFIRELGSNWHIYGAAADGTDIYKAELEFPGAVIIGNESQGISEELLPLLTHKIGIPSFSSGAESLNASVAAGIICSEFYRRSG